MNVNYPKEGTTNFEMAHSSCHVSYHYQGKRCWPICSCSSKAAPNWVGRTLQKLNKNHSQKYNTHVGTHTHESLKHEQTLAPTFSSVKALRFHSNQLCNYLPNSEAAKNQILEQWMMMLAGKSTEITTLSCIIKPKNLAYEELNVSKKQIQEQQWSLGNWKTCQFFSLKTMDLQVWNQNHELYTSTSSIKINNLSIHFSHHNFHTCIFKEKTQQELAGKSMPHISSQ